MDLGQLEGGHCRTESLDLSLTFHRSPFLELGEALTRNYKIIAQEVHDRVAQILSMICNQLSFGAFTINRFIDNSRTPGRLRFSQLVDLK